MVVVLHRRDRLGLERVHRSIAIRALFGAGEAGAFPNLTRIFTTWLPVKERERAQAILWLATRVSGAFTPLLVALLIRSLGWRRTFEILGLLGVVWAVLFYWLVPRRSRRASGGQPGRAGDAAAVSATRRSRTSGVPWRLIFSTPAVWLLSIQYMCLAYGWWFYINWLPTYLRDARGTSLRMGALLAGLPLLLGGAGLPGVGRADSAPRRADRQRGARAGASSPSPGFVGASICIFIFTGIEDPVRAMIVLGFAGFFNDFVMPAAWAGTMDIGGRYSGTVSGAMNMMGSIAGASSVIVVGYLLAWTGNWTLTFYISAAIYLVGAICWLFLDSHTPIERPAAAAARAA